MSYCRDKLLEVFDNQKEIFDEIANIYDYIDENWENLEKEYILEKLAYIQSLAKN